MKDTKKKILSTALKLFNDNGVANTTLRKIAKEINISQGNLNYHYKKREDILEELYFEMVHEFDERVKRTVNKEITLQIFYDESKASMQRMFEYRFIWIDLHQIMRENEKIRNHFLIAQTNRLNGLHFVFQEFIKKKVILPESFPKQYNHFFQRLINFGDFWICSTDIYQKDFKTEDIEKKHQIYFEFIYPYLTENGKNIYQKIIENKL